MKISVCFPAYNEEENIGYTLEETTNVMEKIHEPWEIIVVNDGSTDGTQDRVAEFIKKFKNIKLVNHPKNLGYAVATQSCFNKSTGDFIFVIDSDRQHDMSDIPKFIEKINDGYDIVVGWKIKRNDPPLRILMSKVYNLLFSLIFKYRLHDVDCGFRCLTKEAVGKIKIEYRNVPVGPEIFAKAIKYGMSIAEIPVIHKKRIKGKSIYRPWKIPYVVLKVVFSLLKLKFKLKYY